VSKNFELLQETQLGRDLAPTAELKASQVKTNGNGSVVHAPYRDGVTREESLKLVQSLFLAGGEGSPRLVVFAGIDSGNGCSSISAQVAETLAGQKLGSVCLVDANLRAPVLPDLLGVSNHYGLTDALSKTGPIRDFAKVVRSDNLWLLSCGSLADVWSGLLNSETMKARVSDLRKEFDYVLIDSPPLNAYADGVALAQLADGLVLVLEANCTRREAAIRVAENLRAAQIKILGAVLNKRTFPIPESLYKLM